MKLFFRVCHRIIEGDIFGISLAIILVVSILGLIFCAFYRVSNKCPVCGSKIIERHGMAFKCSKCGEELIPKE